MEKVVRSVALIGLVLAMAGVSNAEWTTTVYTAPVVSEVTLNVQHNYTGYNYGVQWDHEWLIPSDPDLVSISIIDADLSIQSQYTSNKTESIRLASQLNPSLGDLVNGVTSFDVLSYASDLDGDVTVYATLWDGGEWGGQVVLDKSTLSLMYEITKRVWKDDPIPDPVSVPAPGAIVLCSLGAGLVGWLRKRGTV